MAKSRKKPQAGRKANGQFKKGHALAKKMGRKGHAKSCQFKLK